MGTITAAAHFSRSENFASYHGLDENETLTVEINLTGGTFVNLTYETLTDPHSALIAYMDDDGGWSHFPSGRRFSDVTIHFKEIG